jgi:hypothetical protein
MTAGAKSFGSFFTGVVNKAGAKIKETVKDNVSDFCILERALRVDYLKLSLQSILGEFNKEQEAFIKDQSGKSGEPGVCPWVGHQNEDKIKEEILSLSGVSSGRLFVGKTDSVFAVLQEKKKVPLSTLFQETTSILAINLLFSYGFWANSFLRVF